jgi:hypothetical protein
MPVACVLAGLGGMSRWSGYHAGLSRLAGVWPDRVDIMHAYAGLMAWPSRDHECLWIPGLSGLRAGLAEIVQI